MALAEVLSSLREIILDCPDMPRDQSERLQYMRKAFPKLSQHELEDLAKISPEKLEIYSTSIFSGERNLIRRNFPMSVAYIKEIWKELYKEEFDLFEIAKRVHKFKAWKSSYSVNLGENFIGYIKEKLPEISTKYPFIQDMNKMELSLRIVRRSPDDEVMPVNSLKPGDLSLLTVENILELNFTIPTCTIFLDFTHDVVGARRYYLDNNKSLPTEIEKRNCYYGLSRSTALLPAWTEYSKEVFDCLKKLDRAKKHNLSLLAEEFLSFADSNKNEEELFTDFLKIVCSSIEGGSLIIQANR